jgi:peptidoglycan-associated lipoprotein
MKYLAIALAVFILGFYGCAPKVVTTAPVTSPSQTTDRTQSRDQMQDRERTGITEEELEAQRRAAERDRGTDPGAGDRQKAGLLKDILFDFDSAIIPSEYVADLTAAGNWLKQKPEVRLVIEGHTDERGTTEYNLALGQKRAENVKEFLVRTGVQASRMKTLSFGKEMPLDPGHDEQAWAKNRRVHFTTEEKR